MSRTLPPAAIQNHRQPGRPVSPGSTKAARAGQTPGAVSLSSRPGANLLPDITASLNSVSRRRVGPGALGG
jgi:hypothetical protein